MRMGSGSRAGAGRISLVAVGALTAAVALSGCGEPVPPAPVRTVSIFDDNTVHFTPEDSSRYDTALVSGRDNGRVLATYRELPNISGSVRILARLAVRPIRQDIRSVVDRWDRAGHVRLLKPGMAPVEIVRFMTAYGGAIEHVVDVSHLAPLLTGHCEFEAFIDTWVTPAWKLDFALEFQTVSGVAPAATAGTPMWAAGLVFPDGGLTADADAARAEILIPSGTRRTHVYVFTTGHCTDGRDADEFVTKDNVVLVDGVEVYRFRPWRDDCERFRAVNPYCAKWADGSWSSDYARSGWCPGDVVDPVVLDLTDFMTPGHHTLTYRVEEIRPRDAAGQHGYWRVSAHAVGWD